MHPNLPCVNMGCLVKPDDFLWGSLEARINQIIEKNRSTPRCCDAGPGKDAGEDIESRATPWRWDYVVYSAPST
jgi:hypothetical protein